MSPDVDLERLELRRECERLRGENARLSKLLELRGGEAARIPEQTATAVAPGAVTMTSAVADKLALFSSLLRARTDRYAVRWENVRAGTKGWAPAVAGGWRKGMDRRTASPLPLTAQTVAAHLVGDVFIGLYPLLKDNSCHFLAADFDGPAAMLDALAYTKAARAEGVPAALEISQSGRGAHVWVFFTEALPAVTARGVGTALVREAMLMRGSMNLSSYDRLFPNQDVLPDGGYGNLIAAPLNGKRRKDGLTLFLDLGTLEPHDDQWAYLSTLDRLSVGAATRIARQASRQAVGSQVSALTRSAATKVHPPMPAVIHADLGAGLILATTDLPPAAVATFKHAASMANPKFYELQRPRKSTWDTPRFVRGYDVTVDDKLVLPRGLRESVIAIADASGSRLQVADLRTPGTEIDVTLGAELRDEQADAVGAMLAHDDGVLVAPPGSGKTVMACALIAERATSTAVLVDRKALADQWRDLVSTHLGVKAGQLGGGRTKLTGIVDVVMLPSLARRQDVADLLAGYGHVVVDECHHLAAAAYDHTVKKISARYWLGLTATPDRRDGLGDLVSWQLGPVRHRVDTAVPGTLLEIRMQDIAPSRVLHLHETTFRADDVDLAAPGALAAVHHALATNPERNQHVVADIHAALGRGRNVLVLTRRVAHVEALVDLLADKGHRALVLQGGIPAKERRAVIARLGEVKSGDGVLVVGTTPFIGEGFDAPALDTLFLAAPVSFDGLLVQCAGRVVRSHPGKNDAEVHDYHDAQTPILAASLQRRMPGYRTLGFVTR